MMMVIFLKAKFIYLPGVEITSYDDDDDEVQPAFADTVWLSNSLSTSDKSTPLTRCSKGYSGPLFYSAGVLRTVLRPDIGGQPPASRLSRAHPAPRLSQ